MTGWLIDCYRNDNEIILWVKSPDGENHRVAFSYSPHIYASLDAIPDLRREKIPFKIVKRKTYLNDLSVVELKISRLSQFENFVRTVELITKHRIPLYNADIKPEQMFLYERNITPFNQISIVGDVITETSKHETVPLRQLHLSVNPCIYSRHELRIPVRSINFNETIFKGPEVQILRQFAKFFNDYDPDVISIARGYAVIPYLMERMQVHKINCHFDRWDGYMRKYKGGRSYWSYNQVRFQDLSVKLRGRLLIDESTSVGSECDMEGIIEMVGLSGTLFQQTVARSFGAVFQSALVRLMVQEGMIIPFKDKPLEAPISMFTLLKADRGGLTIDPKLGFHSNVAELDFVSMFPWLIYNHNISADSILSDEGPFDNIPELPIRASLHKQGLIPRALKPFIDRRMYYKYHPSEMNNRRSKGLKSVLVSCYGYLRYREFKLGIPTSHMAICAYARDVLLKCVHIAEERGFQVVHGIVDSIYITKPGMAKEDVEIFREELEATFKIPLTCEGIFKWVVFCASRVDEARALPATYFGVFNNGEIKARGIEVRQRGTAPLIRLIQEEALNLLKECTTVEEIRSKVPDVCLYVHSVIENLSKLKPSLLTISLRVGKSDYKHNIPQKIVLDKLFKKGIKVEPGQSISFIFSSGGPVLVDEYLGNPDKALYLKLAIRAMAVLFEPIGVSKKIVKEQLNGQIQMELDFSSKLTATSFNLPVYAL